jgi:hypothetical protein
MIYTTYPSKHETVSIVLKPSLPNVERIYRGNASIPNVKKSFIGVSLAFLHT